MDDFVATEDITRDRDLVNWQAFCLAYYHPIRRALTLLRVSDGDVDELAHSFLLKVAEKNFLETYSAFREKEASQGRTARFRTYLYRSIQNHVRDAYRERSLLTRRSLESRDAEPLAAEPELTLDPDALYALDVLHQALQALRRHCERIGKLHLWVFFEETLLANEFRGRRGKSRAELLDAYPGLDPQTLDNGLTTAKRAFRRFIAEVIPRGLRDNIQATERFGEWMEILRNSNASQFNLLHLAYRVMPFLPADASKSASAAMIVDFRQRPGAIDVYEEPVLVPDDDELSILLGFLLELPLTEMLDAAEIVRYIPLSSPLWSFPQTQTFRRSAMGRPAARQPRPVCLLTLIDPLPTEEDALSEIDLIGLLTRVKSLAKQLRHQPNHTVPEIFSQLIYTLVNVAALVRCGADLHTIGRELLAGNVRWFLRQSWLDDRTRPLLVTALDTLKPPSGPGNQGAPDC